MTCILAAVMPHVSATDKVTRLGHGKDLGYSTLSVGNRGLRLRRPRTPADGKPVTESNLSLCAPAGNIRLYRGQHAAATLPLARGSGPSASAEAKAGSQAPRTGASRTASRPSKRTTRSPRRWRTAIPGQREPPEPGGRMPPRQQAISVCSCSSSVSSPGGRQAARLGRFRAGLFAPLISPLSTARWYRQRSTATRCSSALRLPGRCGGPRRSPPREP
jgi:hypothetical protein